MRSLKAKDFFKIVTGNDLEFRMAAYQFQVVEDVVIEDAIISHNFTFANCKFKKVTFKDVVIKGALAFNNCQAKSIEIKGSTFEDVSFRKMRMDSLNILSNESVGVLDIDASFINNLNISENHRFDALQVGCANEIKKAILTSNGFHNGHGDASSVYLCPERFSHLEIDRLNSGRVEFGTFGEFAKMRVNDVTAGEVALANCSNTNSDVVFTNIKPKEEGVSKFTISDSQISPEVLADHDVKEFDQLTVKNSSVADELSRLNYINQRKRGNLSSKLASLLFFTW